MRLLKSLEELRAWHRQQQGTLGLVPTMGNLHEGHLKLVDLAQQHADQVIVSIFVNPMQFGANEDLDSYPRTLDADCQALAERGVQAVFAPQVTDVYPRGLEAQTSIEVPKIGDILCGASRPGHFRGVATVVAKLFNMVQPDHAVFGEKDYQQLQVIRLMAQDLSFPVEIIGMPTERAADGLALSSRNGYLSASERRLAPILYQVLQNVAHAIQHDKIDAEQALAEARIALQESGFRMDYLELRRQADLQPANATDKDLVVLVAAFLGRTRLIDNLQFSRDA
ncbi:pantoate--beta-alanine ligase [Pseudidiomarina sp. 1APP75-32.1]|uniref:Pantothenate synthetase n=1 Tax=Pseudidiomarina terrestris TaxID=2820060 RepID=A0AAW7QYG5_9GAMM|nr:MULTISPECIES: pantoate--beta-alanine ligase [unclassified Pseudidiomarina]MDN7125270.1 pantoate--beta-alanine ligase [Pseudidiomarina sp. 1APP75-32.1]MDN7127329.1 pantoate--beta-alanine ligase [Pseudidiomarina sp. 1APR75-33.1]MDN7130029.1 pantoate--beta-alanine ligase [Pseudidiomarina sp. 1APR75-15]MEA3588880.1 pantoate--beta-alanine ligase [Pseudidiomarina sp. 1APP75-27a]